jgi:hypothetical protein
MIPASYATSLTDRELVGAIRHNGTLEHYQALVDRTAIYPGKGSGSLWYTLFGAIDEAAEVLEKYDDVQRQDPRCCAVTHYAATAAINMGKVLGQLKKTHRDGGDVVGEERLFKIRHALAKVRYFAKCLDEVLAADIAISFAAAPIPEEARDGILKELGDAHWYPAAAMNELGVRGEEVLAMNAERLLDRKARNVLKGDGDSR